jgi:hypothetical protein
VTRFLLLAAVVAACGKDGVPGSGPGSGSGTTPAGSGSGSAAEACEPVAFAASTPVPEASGAAWLAIDGKPMLVVISDSGNRGAYGLVDPETGATTEQGVLPFGTAADEDLEGIAARGGRLYGITSPGWIYVWTRATQGFALADGPYALGPIDLPLTRGIGDKPPKGTGMVCETGAVNCGRNYEGLCLSDGAVQGPCIGFAASKADGHLHCVTETGGENDGKLAVSYAPQIAITKPGSLADCAFAGDGTLWAGSNLFDMSRVYRVDGWTDPGTAKVVEVAALGVGFAETIAVKGDRIYRMSDTGGAPSLMAVFRCRR